MAIDKPVSEAIDSEQNKDTLNNGLLFKELAPLYERLGNHALDITVASAFLTMLGIGIGNNPIPIDNVLLTNVIDTFRQHLGDSALILPTITLPVAASLVEQISKSIGKSEMSYIKEISKHLTEIGKTLFPYILISGLLFAEIDIETTQLIKYGFLINMPDGVMPGTKDLLDLPIGLISVVGFAKILELGNYQLPIKGAVGQIVNFTENLKLSKFPLNIAGYAIDFLNFITIVIKRYPTLRRGLEPSETILELVNRKKP